MLTHHLWSGDSIGLRDMYCSCDCIVKGCYGSLVAFLPIGLDNFNPFRTSKSALHGDHVCVALSL